MNPIQLSLISTWVVSIMGNPFVLDPDQNVAMEIFARSNEFRATIDFRTVHQSITPESRAFLGIILLPYIICYFAENGVWPSYPASMQATVAEMGQLVLSQNDETIRTFCRGKINQLNNLKTQIFHGLFHKKTTTEPTTPERTSASPPPSRSTSSASTGNTIGETLPQVLTTKPTEMVPETPETTNAATYSTSTPPKDDGTEVPPTQRPTEAQEVPAEMTTATNSAQITIPTVDIPVVTVPTEMETATAPVEMPMVTVPTLATSEVVTVTAPVDMPMVTVPTPVPTEVETIATEPSLVTPSTAENGISDAQTGPISSPIISSSSSSGSTNSTEIPTTVGGIDDKLDN